MQDKVKIVYDMETVTQATGGGCHGISYGCH